MVGMDKGEIAMKIITGIREERTNEAARNGEQLTASNVRYILAEMELQVKSDKKRRTQAAFFAKNARNATSDAIEVYAAYADGAELK